jgi:hypothetical protein
MPLKTPVTRAAQGQRSELIFGPKLAMPDPWLTPAEGHEVLSGQRWPPDPTIEDQAAHSVATLLRITWLGGPPTGHKGQPFRAGEDVRDHHDQELQQQHDRSCAVPKLTVWEPVAGATQTNCYGRSRAPATSERSVTSATRTTLNHSAMVLGIYGSEG